MRVNKQLLDGPRYRTSRGIIVVEHNRVTTKGVVKIECYRADNGRFVGWLYLSKLQAA